MNNSEPAKDITLDIQYVIYGILLPTVAIPGLIANLASFIVFTRPAMRSSITSLLAGLALFDFTLLLLACTVFPPITLCRNGHPKACSIVMHSVQVTYPMSLIAHFGSVWTCVAITVDRFIAVSYPLDCKRWCSTKRAWMVLGGISVCAVVYNIPTFFELQGSAELLRPTKLRMNIMYIRFYKAYLYLAFYLLIPAVIMICLNVMVVEKIRKAFITRSAFLRFSSSSTRMNNERRSTFIAIAVNATFLLCNFWPSLNNYLEHASSLDTEKGIYLEDAQSFAWIAKRTLVFLGNFLVCLNSATNFLIYCLLGPRFRQMFLMLFCPCIFDKQAFNAQQSLLRAKSTTVSMGTIRGPSWRSSPSLGSTCLENSRRSSSSLGSTRLGIPRRSSSVLNSPTNTLDETHELLAPKFKVFKDGFLSAEIMRENCYNSMSIQRPKSSIV